MAHIHMSRLSLILAAFLLQACGSTEAPKSRDRIGDDYSCEFKLEEGPSSWNSKPEKIVQTHFGKFLDRAAIDSVLNLSARATISYVRDIENTDLLRVNTSGEGKCKFYDVLPEASETWQKIWQESAGPSESGLLLTGLYYSKPSSPTGRSTILLRRDSNRWTLIHEFLHHLFTKRGGSATLTELTRDILTRKTQIAIDIQRGALNQEAAKNAITNALKYFWKSDEYINRSALEEIANESILQSEFSSQRLKLVPDKSGSSIAYVTQSAKVAEDLYSSLAQTRRQLNGLLKTAQSPELEKALVDVDTQIDSRLKEIKTLVSKYGDTKQMISSSFNLTELGCGRRSQEIERAIRELSDDPFPIESSSQ
jgi:hypothetical protein